MSRYVKYPRTPHLPWSPGRTSDDRVLTDLTTLAGGEVVVTEKMDGEATTFYPDGYCHARSTTSAPHPSRSRVAALAAHTAPHLPAGWRVCGENVAAVHSIAYTGLPALFLVYSVWDEHDVALPWEETLTWCALLGLTAVPELHRGPLPVAEELDRLWRAATDGRGSEGYVVRTAAGFTRNRFGAHVAKYVRPGHVQTDEHWMYGPHRHHTTAPDLRTEP